MPMRYHQDSEAFTRVRRLHKPSGSGAIRSTCRNPEARDRVPKTGRPKPTQAPSEAKDQAFFRFPRRRTNLESRFLAFLPGFASEFGIGKTFTRNLRNQRAEAFTIVHVLTVVVAEGLLVQ